MIDKWVINLENDCCLFSKIRFATMKLIFKIRVFNMCQSKEYFKRENARNKIVDKKELPSYMKITSDTVKIRIKILLDIT